MTFNTNGDIHIFKLTDTEYEIVESHTTAGLDDDEEMYDSDEEDDVYMKSLRNHAYSQVCSDNQSVSFVRFEGCQVSSYDLSSQKLANLVGLDHKNCFVTLLKNLSSNRLLAVYDTNKFLIHDLTKNCLTDFSKKNLKKFPRNFLSQFNRIYECVELTETQLLLYTHFTTIFVDLKAKVPEFSSIAKEKNQKMSKAEKANLGWNEAISFHHKKYLSLLPHKNFENSKIPNQNEEGGQSENFKIYHAFKSIMHMKKLDDDSLLVMENSWKNLIKRLPNVIKIKRFGQ